MKFLSAFSAAALMITTYSCTKEVTPENLSTPAAWVIYIIPKGEHTAPNNFFKPVDIRLMKFSVQFDSSAVYTTTDPQNQYDINKLYGFADNGDHHQQFSARIGWRWSDEALRLFGYTYNMGQRAEKEIGTISINEPHACSIAVADSLYLFSVDEKTMAMPRKSKTASAAGYQLYPYFGGDETAPHEISIRIYEE